MRRSALWAGGRSGLSLAAAGYLCACIVGVIYLNVLRRRGRVHGGEEVTTNAVTVDDFQQHGGNSRVGVDRPVFPFRSCWWCSSIC